MKKIFALLFATILAAQAWAYDFSAVSNGQTLYYNITSDNTVEVTYQAQFSTNNYSGLTSVDIPESVTYDGKNYAVTKIGSGAFYECNSLQSITIPSTVTTLSNEAFMYCSGLTEVNLPNSVTYIGERVFCYCSSLTEINANSENPYYSSENGILFNKNKTTIVCYPAGKTENTYDIPESVKTIGNNAFRSCNNLTSVYIPTSVETIYYCAFEHCGNMNAITIPSSVTVIDNYTFQGCNSLESVTIPDGVTSIGYQAFCDCSDLTSVSIPSSVTSIDREAFSGCNSIESLTVPPTVEEIGDNAFLGVPSVTYYGSATGNWGATTTITNAGYFEFEDPERTILIGYNGPGGDVYIPNTVKAIGECAFEYCNTITSVHIPNSVTNIGRRSFADCENLSFVAIPNSVANIDNSAFLGCNSLEYLNVESDNPNFSSDGGVLFNKDKTTIICYPKGKKATSYTIPNSVNKIDNYAFWGCQLTDVTIPGSVTSIGTSAFLGSPLKSVTIPNSVTSIGECAFYSCPDLTSVTFESQSNVTTIGSWAFSNCENLTSITVPNSVTSISAEAFEGCNNIKKITYNSDGAFSSIVSIPMAMANLETIVIGDAVTSIPDFAFYDYENLKSVTIGNSVETIGNDAFYNCGSLESIVIPESVKTIGDYAFGACSNLADVEYNPFKTSVGHDAFYGTKYIESTTEYDDGSLKYTIAAGMASVTGYTSTPESVTIPEKITVDGKEYPVTGIGGGAFGYYGLESIIIPNSVKTIGDHAFSNCVNMPTVTIPKSVESVGADAFLDVNNIVLLKDLEGKPWGAKSWNMNYRLSDDGKELLEVDFGEQCPEEIYIPYGVETIADGVFSGLDKLTRVHIPNTVKTIGDNAFAGCTSLSELTIPSSVTTIGKDAFDGVETVIYSGTAEGSPWGATEVKKSADEIEEFEFADAEHTHLIKYNGEGGNVVIPDGVITIGEYAFQNCSDMTSISIPESVTTIENYAFQGCSGLQKAEFASIESLCAISYKDNPYYYYGSPLLKANHLYIKGIEDEITEFTIPESVTTINDYVFYGSRITTLIVPEGIEVGENAFYGIEGYVYPVGITSYPTHGYTIDQSQLEGWTYWRVPDVSYDDCIIISKPGTISTWDCQFNPPAWINPGHKDDEFEISFDARFIGYGKGDITFIQGRQFVNYNDEELPDLCVELEIDEAITSSWQLQMYVEQLIVEEFTGQTDEFEPSKPFRNVHLRPTSEWQTFTIRGLLGRNGQDSVDLSFEFGSISGEYDIRNFTFKVNDKVFASYFSNSEPEPLEQLQANDSRLEGWKPVNATPFYNENVILRNEYSGDSWSSRFDPPTWYAPSKTGDEEFEIIFEAKYDGNGTDGDETGHLTFVQGRGLGSYYDDEAIAMCDKLGIEYVESGWQLQYAVEQMIVDDYTDVPTDFVGGHLARNVHFYPTSNWQTFSMKGHLGRHAKDSVDLQFEFGDIAGDYSIRNFVLIVDGEVFKDYFCSDEFLSDINKQLVKGLKYDFSAGDKTAKVIGYNGTETSVDIPATVEVDGETYRVTVIDNGAFKDNTDLAKVTIAKGIETIGAWAFSGCTGLSKVIVPSSVISIGKDAFAGVPAVNYADDKGFLYADFEHTQLVKYTGSEANITIPSTVVSIGENAFEDNTDLKSVQIPASVKEIGEGAFSGCTGIDNVNLPKTVESIGKNAFKGVKNLTYSGTADVSQCGAKNVIATTVEGDFVFADASKTKLIQYNGTGGNVEIPSTVESIGVQSFKGNGSLTTLVIPNSVKTIEEGAFANCHNLTDVSGGDNLKTIAELAFRGCHHLKNITLPNSVETIGDDAFLYVKNVEYYGIADGEPWGALTVNGYPSGDYIYADREQTRLTAYVGNSKRAFIPEGVIYIGPMAFFESRNLSVVEIPSTVRNIGGMAFANCTNLTKANVPQSVSILGRSVFRDCPYVEIDIEFDSAPYSWSNKWDYTLEEKQIRWGNVAAPQPTPVAVSESAADLQVYAHGNTIVVENATDAIYVYDAMGRLICRDAINRVRAELQVNVAGIYIVKVGTTAKRVMVND